MGLRVLPHDICPYHERLLRLAEHQMNVIKLIASHLQTIENSNCIIQQPSHFLHTLHLANYNNGIRPP